MVNAILKTNEKQKLLSKGSTLISSIPSKSQKYGYFEGKDGELIKAEDPNLPLQFSGDKEDAVGPGSYDPKINSKQNKSVISWDKMSNRNLNCDFNESSTNYTKNNSAINGGGFNNSVNESKALTPKLSINNSKYNPDNYQPERKVVKDLRKAIQNYRNNLQSIKNKYFADTLEKWISENNLHLNTTVMTFKEESDKLWNKDLENKHRQIYHDYSQKNKVPEELQCFGSSVARVMSLEKSNTNLGPGSYFNDTVIPRKQNIKSKSGKIYHNSAPQPQKNTGKNEDENQNFAFSSEDKFRTPTFYDISKNFIKKSYNKYGNFAIAKRFKNENKVNYLINPNSIEIPPGPGSYEVEDYWIKSKNHIKNNSNILTKLIKKNFLKKNYTPKEQTAKFDGVKTQNGAREVSYESIRNNIQRTNKVPFNSNEVRFRIYNHSVNDRIGPGSYNINKCEEEKKSKFGGLSVPFNFEEKKRTGYLNKVNKTRKFYYPQ